MATTKRAPYTYVLAVLGLPIRVKAATLAAARRAVLSRYVRNVTIKHRDLPILPTVILVESDDPRCITELLDPRLRASVTPRYLAVLHAFKRPERPK